ncbi:MAG: hypothetical protein K9M07_02110 [Simkaniaceae bacterium]|nr:hypothetical protein [Simkaniaceae bacterium]
MTGPALALTAAPLMTLDEVRGAIQKRALVRQSNQAVLGAIQGLSTTHSEQKQLQRIALIQSKTEDAIQTQFVKALPRFVDHSMRSAQSLMKTLQDLVPTAPSPEDDDSDASDSSDDNYPAVRLLKYNVRRPLEWMWIIGPIYAEVKAAVATGVKSAIESIEQSRRRKTYNPTSILLLCDHIECYESRYGEPLSKIDIKTIGKVASLIYRCLEEPYPVSQFLPKEDLLSKDELKLFPQTRFFKKTYTPIPPLAHFGPFVYSQFHQGIQKFIIARNLSLFCRLLPAYRRLRKACPSYDNHDSERFFPMNTKLSYLSPDFTYSIPNIVLNNRKRQIHLACSELLSVAEKVSDAYGKLEINPTDSLLEIKAKALEARRHIVESLKKDTTFSNLMHQVNEIYRRTYPLLEMIGLEEETIESIKRSQETSFALNTETADAPLFSFTKEWSPSPFDIILDVTKDRKII